MQLTHVRSKKRDYDMYLKSEKLFLLQLGARKKCFPEKELGAQKICFPAIWNWKNLVPSYFETDKHCCSYLEREKSGSLLFGD